MELELHAAVFRVVEVVGVCYGNPAGVALVSGPHGKSSKIHADSGRSQHRQTAVFDVTAEDGLKSCTEIHERTYLPVKDIVLGIKEQRYRKPLQKQGGESGTGTDIRSVTETVSVGCGKSVGIVHKAPVHAETAVEGHVSAISGLIGMVALRRSGNGRQHKKGHKE